MRRNSNWKRRGAWSRGRSPLRSVSRLVSKVVADPPRVERGVEVERGGAGVARGGGRHVVRGRTRMGELAGDAGWAAVERGCVSTRSRRRIYHRHRCS